ncbi:MAG: ketopantoate reductase family protein [Thermoleophilaceae bacterium]|nr:ketopantoate reductase family protein [Thermoleophilaceae bacterium]
MKITILGAGNMGSVFAARLIDAGHDVSLVARNARLRELETNGLRLRHQFGRKIEQYSPPVFAELTPELESDVIFVMVQRPHIDALMPALEAHPCKRICFLFNCSEIDPKWQAALGNRLVWGFPSAMGGTKDGIVSYVVLPGWLRFLQITTVGVAEGGDPEVAREIVKLLNGAKIASTFYEDMRGWLMTHTSLMLPGMALGEARYRAGKNQKLSYKQAGQMARAQQEGFAVVKAAGLRVGPMNLRLLSMLPAAVTTPFIWLLTQSPQYSRSLLDHVDHAHDEMQTMSAGIKANAQRSGTATPTLDLICPLDDPVLVPQPN